MTITGDRLRSRRHGNLLVCCLAFLLGALALQHPQSLAVEEELRSAAFSAAEADGPEPAVDDPPLDILVLSAIATREASQPAPSATRARRAVVLRNPALNALRPRAPPA